MFYKNIRQFRFYNSIKCFIIVLFSFVQYTTSTRYNLNNLIQSLDFSKNMLNSINIDWMYKIDYLPN